MPNIKTQVKSQNSFCKVLKRKWYHVKVLSFEWSQHRILSTDSEVTATFHVSIIESRNERSTAGPCHMMLYGRALKLSSNRVLKCDITKT